MIWLGVAFLLGSPMGYGELWIGMGMILGGNSVFGKAWAKPEQGVVLRNWNEPDGSKLMYGCILLLIGAGLFLWGWWIRSNLILFWIGFGLTMAGGGLLANVWKVETK